MTGVPQCCARLACALVVIPDAPFVALIAAACPGAGIGIGLSLWLGLAAGGASAPPRLVLAGAAVSALLGALASGVVIVTEIAQDVLFFTAGGVQGVGWGELGLAAPWIIAGLVIALLASPAVSLLSRGPHARHRGGRHAAAGRRGGVHRGTSRLHRPRGPSSGCSPGAWRPSRIGALRWPSRVQRSGPC